jgi:class 3 adenylate cyclase/tetratricopeptide (TPR) repeat protein
MTARAVERRIVTVLFADLVGFTSLSERLDAEDVSLVQDAYFDAVRETIERHGGQLEKFVGDAAMAVFGAPRVRDDDAERAVRAGLALIGAIARIGSSLGLEEGVLRIRVGVNSGEAVYGEATADRGPVTGDTVNVAARLQAAAEPGSVVVGELTALAVSEVIELDPIGPLNLKGKSDAVLAFRVAGIYPERSRERALGGLRAPIIGRERELEQLGGAVGNGCRRIVVVAPPGVGKTRLVEELGDHSATTGAVVLRARLRPDLLSPFEPVGQLVRSIGDPDDVIGRLAAGRAEVVRDALAAVIAPVEAPASLWEERERLFAAWLEGLDALAGRHDSVWLVEDLHWASADLLAFLDFAGRAPGPHGRLVIGTSRPTLLESAGSWCDGGEVLHLNPLLEAETAALVRALVADALPPELVDRIAEASGGNALFVEELLRTWASTGALVQASDGSWAFVAEAQDVSLPPTVQAIYAGQLDDLPPQARAAARKASVAGRRFPLAALEPLEVDEAADAVATLERRVLIAIAPPDPILGASYVYRHALLRDAGYASLARGDRARLHVLLADWLSALPDDATPTLAEVIARHYAAAFEIAPSLAQDIAGHRRDHIRDAAASWFERAAEVAVRFAAWESARALAQRSVELSVEAAPLVRARRLEQLARPTANTVGVAEAEPLLREALEHYRLGRAGDESGARKGLASSGAALGDLLHSQTRFAEGEQLATALLQEVGQPDDAATGRLLVMRSSAIVSAWDDYDRSAADAVRALTLAREAGDPILALDALTISARIQTERGDPHAYEVWDEVEQLARRAGNWEKVSAAARIQATRELEDSPDEVVLRLGAARGVADAYGLVEDGAWCDYGLAEAYLAAGRWDEAIAAGRCALTVAAQHDFSRVAVRTWFVLLPIARVRRREDLVGEASQLFAKRLDNAPDSHYARVIATAAHLHFAAFGLEPAFVPDVESRLPSFDLAHDGPSWLAAIETLVETWLEAGELDGAEQALDRMRASLDKGAPSRLARATEALLRAKLFLARGDPAASGIEAKRSLELLGDKGAPWWRAKAIRALERAGEVSVELAGEGQATEARLRSS